MNHLASEDSSTSVSTSSSAINSSASDSSTARSSPRKRKSNRSARDRAVISKRRYTTQEIQEKTARKRFCRLQRARTSTSGYSTLRNCTHSDSGDSTTFAFLHEESSFSSLSQSQSELSQSSLNEIANASDSELQRISEMAMDDASNDTDRMFMDAFGLSNLNWSATVATNFLGDDVDTTRGNPFSIAPSVAATAASNTETDSVNSFWDAFGLSNPVTTSTNFHQ